MFSEKHTLLTESPDTGFKFLNIDLHTSQSGIKKVFLKFTGWQTEIEMNINRDELLEALDAQEKPDPPFELPINDLAIVQRTFPDSSSQRYIHLKKLGIWKNINSGYQTSGVQLMELDGEWKIIFEGSE